MQLPQLSNMTVHHPDCCCSISNLLLSKLASILPTGSSELTLSVGSGTGLLEALLVFHRPTVNLRGVEISKNVNRYLPENSMEVVKGTWDFCPLARTSSAWVFVYPRDIRLITKYAQAFDQGGTKCIIWIGPVADLQEVEESSIGPCWEQEVLKDCGLSEYEALVLWKRTDLHTG